MLSPLILKCKREETTHKLHPLILNRKVSRLPSKQWRTKSRSSSDTKHHPSESSAAHTTHDTTHRVANAGSDTAHPLGHLETDAHTALNNHIDDVKDGESGTADGAEDGECGDGPENEGEVEIIAHVLDTVGLGHGHGEDHVGHHPDGHHVRAHAAVVVLL